MKKNKLFESLNDIDDKIIEEVGESKDLKKKKRFNPMEFIIPLVAVAAIMIVVLPTFLNRDTPPKPSQDIGERQDVIQEIKIFKAEEFDKPSSELLSVLNDEESLKVFNNVISTAQKQDGIADITSPDYVFDIYYANDSKERLYLWLQEKMLGSFMKSEDTHTIYNFSENMNNKLRDLIQKSGKLSIEIGDSERFTREEITEAIELVEENFNFPASTLKRIYYDEEKSDSAIRLYMLYGKGQENEVKKENIIVLLSDFYVDDSGDNPVLNEDSTYEAYNWILIREDNQSKWMIDDQGY